MDEVKFHPFFELLDKRIRHKTTLRVLQEVYEFYTVEKKTRFQLDNLYEAVVERLPIDDANIGFPLANAAVKITYHKFKLYIRWLSQRRETFM